MKKLTDREICEKIIENNNCAGLKEIQCDNCCLKSAGCTGFTWSIERAKQYLLNNPKPEAKMITREELIEKCKGKVFKPVDEEEWNLCTEKCKSVGIKPYFDFEMKTNTYFKINSDCEFVRHSDDREYFPAKAFLSYFNIEEKVEVKAYPEELKFKSRKDFLLARIKQIEAHKKESNQTIDKQIESLQKEMTCDGCYIQEDGQYKINESRVNSESAVEVAEFINRMEADFE